MICKRIQRVVSRRGGELVTGGKLFRIHSAQIWIRDKTPKFHNFLQNPE